MIRFANGFDAEAIMDINSDITLSEETTRFFISSPEELSYNLNEEKEKIEKTLAKGNLFAVYEAEGEVVGYLVFKRYEYTRLNHAGSMGMGIKDGYRNQGIGSQLIKFLIDWAKQQDGLEKICLGVVSVNERAINVYQRLGFVEEGRQRNQIKYEDGSYSDDIMMAYTLH
ncbi:GNAT family N-acetyltransferase [Planomicrobium sp. CPCC 101079]|uniref:GNAT family N-acetyltransferase n=1 Tax=Planomicrobium sp. CPCC 101079 TaxID=2599618 RepID=UPI0011B6B9B9|nr:GNAT family N-acetyltransferase [Planomicrobium sp. CPCC 101079]TWT13339.1 GNAT family N-acetyltransferase [Planomicrobium sp. CPCC 101079]